MKNFLPICLIAFSFLLPSKKLFAQEQLNHYGEQFFSIYKNSPMDAADYLFKTNKWFEKNQESVSTVKYQLRNALEILGEYNGYEEITEKSIGESYVLRSYLVKYDRQPLRFTFIFYKPKDNWILQNFKFDDSLAEELEESAKAYWLPENRL